MLGDFDIICKYIQDIDMICIYVVLHFVGCGRLLFPLMSKAILDYLHFHGLNKQCDGIT